MVAVAEECFDKARASVHDVAMSLNDTHVEEYQKLISTGLACLEASLQGGRLSPRQEARMRLRYAAVLLEETENLMEAETALSKGISLCEKVSAASTSQLDKTNRRDSTACLISSIVCSISS